MLRARYFVEYYEQYAAGVIETVHSERLTQGRYLW